MKTVKIFVVYAKNRNFLPDDWVVLDRFENILNRSEIFLVDKIQQADVVVVVGGDGTMLGAIRRFWIYDKPFFGINRGTRGFTLNPMESLAEFIEVIREFDKHTLIDSKLIRGTFQTTKDRVVSAYAFNDVYVNAFPGSTITGYVRGEKGFKRGFLGDGVIVCTPQGSTAYNAAAGGTVMDLDDNAFGIMTICPITWPIAVSIQMQKITIDIEKGRAVAHADNKRVNNVKKIVVEPSGNFVWLVFKDGYDFEKIRYLPRKVEP